MCELNELIYEKGSEVPVVKALDMRWELTPLLSVLLPVSSRRLGPIFHV